MNKRILGFAMSCLVMFAMVGCNKTANKSEANAKKELGSYCCLRLVS